MLKPLAILLPLVLVHCQDIPKLKFATPCKTPNNQNALCLEAFKCTTFNEEFMNPEHEFYNFWNLSLCAPPKAELKVCCGPDNNFNTSTRPFPEVQPQLPLPDNSLENPLPANCGRHKVDIPFIKNRIFGGNEAVVGEFPWLVRLRHRTRLNTLHFGCNGILIHEKFILTAAHCVANQDLIDAIGEVHDVILGDHDTRTDIDCSTGPMQYCSHPPLVVLAGKAVVYSGYTTVSNNHNNDLAIIPLKSTVKFTNYVQPLCLMTSASNQQAMWVAGWGRTPTSDYSDVKLKTEVLLENFAKCNDKYRSINVNLKGSNQICAGGIDGHDSCTGDSGGALMVNVDGVWYGEGIVSFGVGCAKKGWPGVYTNIPKYVGWIKNTITRKLKKMK